MKLEIGQKLIGKTEKFCGVIIDYWSYSKVYDVLIECPNYSNVRVRLDFADIVELFILPPSTHDILEEIINE